MVPIELAIFLSIKNIARPVAMSALYCIIVTLPSNIVVQSSLFPDLNVNKLFIFSAKIKIREQSSAVSDLPAWYIYLRATELTESRCQP